MFLKFLSRKRAAYIISLLLMICTGSFCSFAYGWQQNGTGYWYGTNEDNSTYYHDGWQWIDGDGNGIAECYYFNSDGYLLTDTTTPDGYLVNSSGCWVQDGVIQTQSQNRNSAAIAQRESINGFISGGTYNVVFDNASFTVPNYWKRVDDNPAVKITLKTDNIESGLASIVFSPGAFIGGPMTAQEFKVVADEYAEEVYGGNGNTNFSSKLNTTSNAFFVRHEYPMTINSISFDVVNYLIYNPFNYYFYVVGLSQSQAFAKYDYRSDFDRIINTFNPLASTTSNQQSSSSYVIPSTGGTSYGSRSGSGNSNVGSGLVYWTPNGKKYHSTPNCPSLGRSKTIYSGTLAECPNSSPCKDCH